MNRVYILVVVAGLLVGGCANTSPYWAKNRLAYTPKAIKVYKTNNLMTWCGKGDGRKWYACATRDYATGECAIYVDKVYFNDRLVHHEKCHCWNWDHDSYPGVASPACPVDVDKMPHTVSEL